MSNSWKKPQIKEEDIHVGCINCSCVSVQADLDIQIAVGFGAAFVEKNGTQIYDGERDYRNGLIPKCIRDFEEMARKDPDNDWRVVFHGPMHGETFQRQGEDNWVCIESKEGFA